MSASRRCDGRLLFDEERVSSRDRSPLETSGTRREAFARLASLLGVASVAAGGLALAGCSEAPKASPLVRVPLASLPPGGRLRVLYRGDPVELRRTADGVVARSLLCTHQGCEVKWQEAIGRYLCPCHQSTYDDNGVPLSGAPTRPLGKVPVHVEGSEAVVGEEERG